MKYVAGLLGALISVSSFAADSTITDFAIKQARDAGFTGCDAAIEDIHAQIGSNEVVVMAKVHQNPNILSMITPYGAKGDSLMISATIVKAGKQCFYEYSVVAPTEQTCIGFLNERPGFKYSNEVGDYILTESHGDVSLVMLPTETGCLATFSLSGMKDVNL